MARSSKNNKREETAFLYTRISRDDDLVGDSYSISNQKKLLAIDKMVLLVVVLQLQKYLQSALEKTLKFLQQLVLLLLYAQYLDLNPTAWLMLRLVEAWTQGNKILLSYAL